MVTDFEKNKLETKLKGIDIKFQQNYPPHIIWAEIQDYFSMIEDYKAERYYREKGAEMKLRMFQYSIRYNKGE